MSLPPKQSSPSMTRPDTQEFGKMFAEYIKTQERPWWFQTAKEVRESDESKVRDYKEDIDTLLVFGALFSAVITAFLLESYRNLSPDMQEISVQVLLHMSQQLSSFTVNGPFSNSTIPAFILPKFTPLTENIVINAAWFASLIVSLMAASYGMLVKQWLREFLATQEASPLVRLRIRCFRYPALAKWRVFEIVAALPLLLQVSLGLFFIGLWYFASLIHPVIEWTVGPLVVIWALLFLAATLAPIFSANCPYKTTFLKDLMVHLRHGRFILMTAIAKVFWASIPCIILKKITSHRSDPPEQSEEEDVVRKDGDDIEVLKQVDLNQVDDGLISPALVEIGRQHPGPSLIELVFSILGRRDILIKRNHPGSWKHTRRLSATLLKSICEALNETLKHEYERLSSLTPTQTSHEWTEWLLTSIQFLIFMSQSAWFTPAFCKTISYCLSITNPDSIDKLLSGWSADEEKTIAKQTIFLIDPSAADPSDFRPLTLHRVSDQLLKKAIPLVEQMIFPEDTASIPDPERNPDNVVGFRMVFGEYQDRSPDVLDTIRQRIRDTVDKNSLVDRLLRPLSSKPSSPGDGRTISAYVFRIVHVLWPKTEIEEIADLSEESKRLVHRTLIGTLQDESEVGGKQPAIALEESFLDAVYTIILYGHYVHDDRGMDVLSSFFERHPDAVANGILDRLSKEPTINRTLSTLIPGLFCVFLHMDRTRSYDDEPWKSTLEIPAHPAMRNILVNVTARCLASELGKPNNVYLWFKWGIHLLLSCFESGTRFSDSTKVAITKLISPNPHFIIRSIPLEEDEQQIDRLWRILCILDPPQRISFITPLWSRSSKGEKRIPFKLLQMHADGINKNVVEVFLQDTPQDFHTHTRVVRDFIFSFERCYQRNNVSTERWLDELQPLIKAEAADDAVVQITGSTASINDPRWPVWMKDYLAKHIKTFQSTSKIPATLKECLCWNATEGIALIAEHGVEYLDKLPDDLLTYRKSIGQKLMSMFKTFVKHPEPLDPEQAEKCLMRLIVYAEVDRLMWSFCTHACFDNDNPPPRYACVSFLTRVLKYYLDPKGVSIAQKDIRSSLDLTQLEKEVWDDASSAATEILNRTEFFNNRHFENNYFGGQKTSSMAHMDAIMILLATSPHPFSTDLCYKVLEQGSFFCWEDNPAIQPDVQRDLEERRQRRIEEGRRLGYLVSSTIVEVVDNLGSRIEDLSDNDRNDDEDERETEREKESISEATHDSELQIRSQQRSPDSDGEQEGREQGRSSSSMVEVDTGTHTDVLKADNEDNGRAGRRDVEQEEYMQDDVPDGDVEQGEATPQASPVIENDATTLQDM